MEKLPGFSRLCRFTALHRPLSFTDTWMKLWVWGQFNGTWEVEWFRGLNVNPVCLSPSELAEIPLLKNLKMAWWLTPLPFTVLASSASRWYPSSNPNISKSIHSFARNHPRVSGCHSAQEFAFVLNSLHVCPYEPIKVAPIQYLSWECSCLINDEAKIQAFTILMHWCGKGYADGTFLHDPIWPSSLKNRTRPNRYLWSLKTWDLDSVKFNLCFLSSQVHEIRLHFGPSGRTVLSVCPQQTLIWWQQNLLRPSSFPIR